ncbi:hypothetical protein FE257_013016 [Aspergillus nanangensis]|uniref:Rhamnogalacturonase A/B/Epimerase-like pectate lyase domain-containing protein n=1 Tax=Aspergillus nanangensis TaxID=2582783 RepID=A0AAD4GPJ0_ASPNN|nr:hypothetical protein FE257_013016 [Aspergillus nanangensis]
MHLSAVLPVTLLMGSVAHGRVIPEARAAAADGPSFWMESIEHQGVSPFGDSGYTVFRNVKDFGAAGDGSTDDTDAINNAMSSGDRCGKDCFSSTTTPAIVYFPAGTYMISASIFDFYNTKMIGNPNAMPVIKASSNFEGGYMIDGDPYFGEGLNWAATTVFWREIKNIVFDSTDVSPDTEISGVHWPTAQATNLQNLVFEMSAEEGTKHQGLFCESGSAGFVSDLVFNGGKIAAALGNQQFTMRNLTFNNAQTAISHFWDWGWTYQGITINDCKLGIDISTGGVVNGSVGSITLFDSTISNTPIAINSAQSETSLPHTAGSIILENVDIMNVPVVVNSTSGTVLAGSSGADTIAGWGQGNKYTPDGPTRFQDAIKPVTRPEGLLDDKGRYYSRSKPQYESMDVSSFASARAGGAKGDGTTDDTAALQKLIDSSASAGKIVYLDAGVYKVTKTLTIPADTKIVGEAYPVIMSSGEFFADQSAPKPVIQVGKEGSEGQVELSDFLISTQGAQAGAILVEWNMASTDEPSGMWEVHVRLGGFEGSMQTTAECAKTPEMETTADNVKQDCIAAYMLMHVTAGASNLYMENCWLWVSDHDMDVQTEADGGQITLYSGRGLNIESTKGNIWLSGTSVEHNVLYEYQFISTKNIYMGQIQTESAYYQPNPSAMIPFTVNKDLHDPDFSNCDGSKGNCEVGWGLRVVDSTDLHVYGAGLYSFFDNYDAVCSKYGGEQNCQEAIFSIEGESSITVYNLNVLGSTSMIDQDGKSLASHKDNQGVFTNNIAYFVNK